MSAIFGIIREDDEDVDASAIEQMDKTLKVRGPDGGGIWRGKGASLGHRMLHTTPESLHEQLPLRGVGRRLIFTGDCRIDNREQLHADLEEIRPLSELTDSDLVLASFIKWGEKCAERLIGDFAYAIWDEAERTLFCARDHLGIRPFYYYRKPGSFFCFATEIKGLLCVPGVPQLIDEERIGCLMNAVFGNFEATSYREIIRLPPAHRLRVRDGAATLERYWNLDPASELPRRSDEEYAKQFREIFTEAVRCRLRSAFPVGAQLSGGLDSSSVTCVARRELPASQPLHTFSNIFPQVPRCDERAFIDAVLEGENYIPHSIEADRIGPLADVDFVMDYEEEACIQPNTMLTLGLAKAAADAGVKVCLDGFDGDTIVSHGELRMTELVAEEKWDEFAAEITAMTALDPRSSSSSLAEYFALPALRERARRGEWRAFFRSSSALAQRFRVPASRMLRAGAGAVLPQAAKSGVRSLLNPRRAKAEHASPYFRSSLEAKLSAHCKQIRPGDPDRTVRERQCQAIVSDLVSLALEVTDRMSARFAAEMRHPFLDKRLVEFCVALPSDQKMKNGIGRVIMRRALHGILPPKVEQRRDKADMGANFIPGLFQRDREQLRKLILEENSRVAPFVQTSRFKELYIGILKRGTAKQYEILIIWRVLTTALWMERAQFGRLANDNNFDHSDPKAR